MTSRSRGRRSLFSSSSLASIRKAPGMISGSASKSTECRKSTMTSSSPPSIFLLEFIHGNSRDAQLAKEALPGEEFVSDVSCESAQDQDQQSAAEILQMFRDALDLAAEHVTQAEERACPHNCAQGIVEKETPCAHVKDACERRCDGAQARNKFSKEQRTGASFRENAFGAAHAGIRLERNLAEKLENSYALVTAERIPDGIRGYGGEHHV